MISFIVVIACVLAVLAVSAAKNTYGVEFYNNHYSSKEINCMHYNGAHFIVPTALQTNAVFDDTACVALKNAKDVGIAHRDVRLFPTVASGTGDAQVTTLVTQMKSVCADDIWSGRIWLDISAPDNWASSAVDSGDKNRQFFQQMTDECTKQTASGVTCGVYSSIEKWNIIFNDTNYSYAPASTFPLWYIGMDGDYTTMTDYRRFGGYAKPYGKTYANEQVSNYCGETPTFNLAFWNQ